MLEHLLEIAVAAAAAAIAATAPLIVPPIRRWMVEKARLDHIVGDDALARRLDEGVINLIQNAMEELQAFKGTRRLTPNEIASEATSRTMRQFPQTLERLGMNGVQTREYVKARIRHAEQQTNKQTR